MIKYRKIHVYIDKQRYLNSVTSLQQHFNTAEIINQNGENNVKYLHFINSGFSSGVTKHRTAHTARTARGAVTACISKHRTARTARNETPHRHRTARTALYACRLLQR